MKKLPIALVALITLIISPTAVFAHAGVVVTMPAQDQVMTSMASEISIQFSEELLTFDNQKVNTLSLSEFDGPEIELDNLRVESEFLKAEIPPGDYAPGIYEVNYRIVSADGHQVSGSFTFSLNSPAVTTTSITSEGGDGVLPPPILAALAILILLGGFFALRSRKG
jgi:methionine-rich copper-binding protein CopC